MRLYKNKILLIIELIIVILLNNTIFAYNIEEETNYIWVENEIINSNKNTTEEPLLDSKYIVAIDRESKKKIYGKNEDVKVPMASTTKIMTAIILLENMEKNNLSLDTEIEVCNQAASIGGSRLGLKKGDKIILNDLLYGLMLCSRK